MIVHYEKILILNLGGIGDFVLSTIALKALRRSFDRAKIDLLAVPWCGGNKNIPDNSLALGVPAKVI